MVSLADTDSFLCTRGNTVDSRGLLGIKIRDKTCKFFWGIILRLEMMMIMFQNLPMVEKS